MALMENPISSSIPLFVTSWISRIRLSVDGFFATDEPNCRESFPAIFLVAVCIVSLIPISLNLLGVDFASVTPSAEHDHTRQDILFHSVTGGLHHALMEWSSVSIAALTVMLSFANFRVSQNVIIPILGLAFFASGLMDAFHTLGALRIFDTLAENEDYIPFSWALSRSFSAIFLLGGGLLGLSWVNQKNAWDGKIIFFSALILVFIAISTVLISSGSQDLPKTLNPGAMITRPYDLFPLMGFLIAIPVYVSLYRKQPNYLVAGILIGFIPGSVLEIHMAFGSSALFDNHFNIAHFLKIFAYLSPFIGLILDYQRSHLKQASANARLAESEERFEIAMSAANSGVWDWDIKKNVLYWSDRFRQITGFEGDDHDVPATFELFSLKVHPSDRDRVDDAMHAHLTNKTPYNLDYRIMAQGDKYRWFHATAQASFDDNGDAIKMAGSLTDIDDAKSSENALIVMNQRLSVAHEELERFTYVASHDLKAPLRGIDSLATWLEEDLEDVLQDENREHFRLMRSRVGRLEGLLSDLLAYSRAGSINAEIEAFDCNKIAYDIHDLIGKPEYKLEIEGELPSLFSAKSPFELVLRNLIQNAIKHHDKDEGRITLKAWIENKHYHFTVSDDGPGIAPEFHHRVFGLFQTLQSRDKVEGSGMGLALIRKVLISCNTDITIHSNPEKERGTTFEFTWPLTWKEELAA